MPTRVKICGITRLEDAQLAVELGAAALGFNFFRPSPRYLAPEAAREIIGRLPLFVATVGVFADEIDGEHVDQVARQAGVAVIQLHGPRFPGPSPGLENCPLIRAVAVKGDFRPADLARLKANAFLLDTFDADGRTTEYSLLSEAMKAIRDKVLLHQIPCIVVTHLNRPDRKIKRIVPDLDDLHGSSNIGKISTGSFFISRDPDASINGDLPTLIRIAKNRDNGSSVNYVAQMLFDESLNSYKEDYMLFRLKNFDTEMEEIKKENMPCWAKGAANGREIPTTTKVTSKCQMDLGYK